MLREAATRTAIAMAYVLRPQSASVSRVSRGTIAVVVLAQLVLPWELFLTIRTWRIRAWNAADAVAAIMNSVCANATQVLVEQHAIVWSA